MKKELNQVIEKAYQFVSLKLGNMQFLEIMNFLRGATSLDCFLKAYKTSETKRFFPYEWFDSVEKLSQQSLPAYDEFSSQLRNCNPLDKTLKNQNLTNVACNIEEALPKIELSEIPPTGQEKYVYLQVWKTPTCSLSKTFFAGTERRIQPPL